MPNPIRLLHPSSGIEQTIDNFAIRLRAQSRSEHTISAYVRDMRCFARALPTVDIGHITPAMIDAALIDPVVTHSAVGAPRSAATMYRLKAVVRSFFAWTAESGLVDASPAKAITTKRLVRTPPEFLTEAEKRRLLK